MSPTAQTEAAETELLTALKTAREIIDNLSGVVHGKPADGSTIAGIDALIAQTEAADQGSDQGSAQSLPVAASKRAVGHAEPSAAFTPGPWLYRPNELDDWGWVKASSGGLVAMARDPRVPHDEHGRHRTNRTDPWEANARLIAAAPDLLSNEWKNLATMEWAAVRLRAQGLSCEELTTAIEQTRAAIARATGGAS